VYIHWGKLTLGYSHHFNISLELVTIIYIGVNLPWGTVTDLILAWSWLLFIHWGEFTLGYGHCVNISVELATVYALGGINPGVQSLC